MALEVVGSYECINSQLDLIICHFLSALICHTKRVAFQAALDEIKM
jgi:hypothetical protein